VTTLSYWRSGARHPEGSRSAAAVEELERLLLLPPRSLTARIGPSKRPGQTGRLGAAFADDREQLVHEVIAELATDPQEALREIWASVVANASARRSRSSLRSAAAACCRRRPGSSDRYRS
jgi:hypothetical protein